MKLDASDFHSVRYPHACHGNAGRTSNSSKTSVMEDFLTFVDTNSQTNGQNTDSTGPTFYFLPNMVQLALKHVRRIEQSVSQPLPSSIHHDQSNWEYMYPFTPPTTPVASKYVPTSQPELPPTMPISQPELPPNHANISTRIAPHHAIISTRIAPHHANISARIASYHTSFSTTITTISVEPHTHVIIEFYLQRVLPEVGMIIVHVGLDRGTKKSPLVKSFESLPVYLG